MERVILTYSDRVREDLLAGVEKVAKAVVITLGSQGMSVIAERKYAAPLVTNDGVTIARGIELSDPQENQGCLLVKEAAEKTNTDTGDGTTTVVLLVEAILREGIRQITAGGNPQAIKRGIERAVVMVVHELMAMAKPIKTRREKQQVATISAGNDFWGLDIVEAIERAGEDGVVTVEEGSKAETVIETIDGFQFENGLISPYFVNKPEHAECVFDDPYLIFIDRDILSFRELMPILEKIKAKSRPFLLIANTVEGEALTNLILNKMKGILPCAAVRAPAIGNKRQQILQDMAILTGGKVLSRDAGIELKEVTVDDLGQCKKVIINKDYTTIMGGSCDKAAVEGRKKELRGQIKLAENDFEKGKLTDRLARLSGGIAQIMVGASTETEMKAKKYKYEDALYATKAAIAEGVVPGGGVALLNCLEELLKFTVASAESVGYKIVYDAIQKPIMQIAENAGLDGEVVKRDALKAGRGMGLNADTREIVDMVEEGIIDPVKVTRLALQNAASTACQMLICGCEIVDVPQDDIGDRVPAPNKRKYGRNPGQTVY